jgi:hypothetical protein
MVAASGSVAGVKMRKQWANIHVVLNDADS